MLQRQKAGEFIFCIAGMVAVATPVIFFFAVKINFYIWAAIPLLLPGLLMFVEGCTVYNRSHGEGIRSVYAYDMNPGS